MPGRLTRGWAVHCCTVLGCGTWRHGLLGACCNKLIQGRLETRCSGHAGIWGSLSLRKL